MKKKNHTSSVSKGTDAEAMINSVMPIAGRQDISRGSNQEVSNIEVQQTKLEKEIHELLEAGEKGKMVHNKSVSEAIEFSENMISKFQEPQLVLDQNLTIIKANSSYYEFFKTDFENTIGKLIFETENRRWDIPELRRQLENFFLMNSKFENFEVTIYNENRESAKLLLNAQGVEKEIDKEKFIILAFIDITGLNKEKESMRLPNSQSAQILDQLLEGCMIVGFDWTYLYLNDAIIKGNYTREELVGRSMLEMYPGVEKTSIFANYERCMDERIPLRFEEEYTFNDGTSIWNTFSVEPVPEGIFVLTIDITQRKKAEETLRFSEAKWRGLFEILPVGVSISNFDRKVLEFNSALCNVLEISKEEMLNDLYAKRKYFKPDNTLMKPQDFVSYRAIHENITIRDFEFSTEKEDGSRIWLNVNAVPLPDLMTAILVTTNITDRKKWEEELKSSKMQLDQLYKHISEVREEERAAVAREIHDELGQSLASLKLDLIAIKEEYNESSELKQKIDLALSQVDYSIKNVQKISSALRPQMLDALGLASAIEWLSNDCYKRFGIRCKLNLQDIEELDEKLSISLFRIFQASMTNIMLHSRAKSVAVKLFLKQGVLFLSVKDDGIGITQEQINSPKSFGIIGIKERVRLYNGLFKIHSGKNKGTELIITIPLTGKPPFI